jgi:serine/threonine protein kinase
MERVTGALGVTRVIKNRFVLKEYYPKELADFLKRVSDTDHTLVIHNDSQIVDEYLNPVAPEEKKAEFEGRKRLFCDSLDKQDIHKYVDPNYTFAGKLFELNNTCYVLSEYKEGDSLLINRGELRTLNSVVEVMLSICESVKRIHDDGLLNLDIKPANIFKFKGKNSISWYDLGSMQSIESIRNQDVHIDWSYSPNYAAPELIYRDRDMICEVTDVYSIGAVLFWLIFDRVPEHSDLVHIASGEDIFKYGDVQVSRVYDDKKVILRDIFSNTLREETIERWNCKQLIEALKNLKITSGEVLKRGIAELGKKSVEAFRDLKELSKANLRVSKLGVVISLFILFIVCGLAYATRQYWLPKDTLADAVSKANQILSENILDVHKNRAYGILGEPLTYFNYSFVKEATLHQLGKAGFVYLFIGDNDFVEGMIVQSRLPGIEVPIPNIGKFTLGKDAYSDLSNLFSSSRLGRFSKYKDREYLPQLFSVFYPATVSLAWPNNYTEYIPVGELYMTYTGIYEHVILLGDNARVFGDVDKYYFDIFANEYSGLFADADELDAIQHIDYGLLWKRETEIRKRENQLYPRSEDNILEKDTFLLDPHLLQIDEDEEFFPSLPNIYVVDRLNTDEMKRYEIFRKSAYPTIIGIFADSKIAASIFASGQGIVPFDYYLRRYEKLRSPE